ncbi:hypothetical protein [Streptomyces lonegramiae]|uniref:UL36 very large tegument protein n=1 Tax=Streptomyces lonegramiae TaxID=3075524 RepID=A0ABU2XAU6_9ACTN|nr:hypothetical protein [Streptomyces sp. DSM 41529]MDT0543038.1 hypothetical protein [Streptomyces sp. DSM 41529]
MSGGQLPAEVAEFARYLRALTRRLDAEKGWYGVFAQRDPEGIRACLDGREVPPWDVVQALLQDLSAQRGPEVAQEAAARAAGLYRASVTAYDTTVGGRAALRDRLEAMLREQRQAAQRERELHAAVRDATAEDDGDADARERLSADLAWARDDWERATARCEELRARLAALPPSAGAPGGLAVPEGWFRDEAAATGSGQGGPAGGAAARMRRPRGSRFAAAYEETGGGQEPAEPGGPGAARPAGMPGAPGGPGSGGPGQVGAAGAGRGEWAAGSAEPGRTSPMGGRWAADGGPGGAAAEEWGAGGGGGAPATGAGTESGGMRAAAGPGGGPAGPAAAAAGAGPGDAGPAPGGRARPRGARFAGLEESAPVSRPRGARFAGAAPVEATAVEATAVEATAAEAAEVAEAGEAAEPGDRATPRGARFAGAYEGGDGAKRRRRLKAQEEDARRAAQEAARTAEARQAAAEAVARLARLRATGRGGEAHVLLCEAAAWPAPWLPLLAAELERAGLEADVATLLWEVACLPPTALAAAADALVASGRGADGARLLRQSVARPVTEVAQTVLALLAAGSSAEAAFLLEALVRARKPDEAAQAAVNAPAELVPLLLDAASGVSSSSHHDLAHALRVAGLPGVPGLA